MNKNTQEYMCSQTKIQYFLVVRCGCMITAVCLMYMTLEEQDYNCTQIHTIKKEQKSASMTGLHRSERAEELREGNMQGGE